jgi:hypothetical protein
LKLDLRERMDGANPRDGEAEGPFELYLEKIDILVEPTGNPPLSGYGIFIPVKNLWIVPVRAVHLNLGGTADLI